MASVHNVLIGLGAMLVSTSCLAAQDALPTEKHGPVDSVSVTGGEISLSPAATLSIPSGRTVLPALEVTSSATGTQPAGAGKGLNIQPAAFGLNRHDLPLITTSLLQHPSLVTMNLTTPEPTPYFKNKRTLYASLWAFASLNYLYADVTGLMDANMLAQYQRGVVDGTKISPGFLTMAAGLMQIPIANVVLPHVIKNEKALRWVQIASGTLMTLVQAGTLFAGKPTPYYGLFSAFEIAATTYITLDAIRWKPRSGKKQGLTGR